MGKFRRPPVSFLVVAVHPHTFIPALLCHPSCRCYFHYAQNFVRKQSKFEMCTEDQAHFSKRYPLLETIRDLRMCSSTPMFDCVEAKMLENFGDCTAFVKNHSEEYSNLGPSKDKGSWHLCSAGIFGIGNTNNVHESTFGQLKLDKEIFSYQTHRKFIEVGTQKVCNFFYRLNCRISIEGASGGSAQNIIGPGLFSLEDKFPRGYRIASPARQLHVATRDIIRPILINAFLLDPRLDLAGRH